MITVLFISHETKALLGSTLSLFNMICSLKQDVTPIVVIPEKGVVCDFFVSKGVKCIVIPFPLCITNKTGLNAKVTFLPRLLRDTLNSKSAFNSLLKELNGVHVDLIHTNTSVVDWGYKLSKQLDIPHVWHLREFQNLDFNLNPYKGWNNLISKVNKAAATISITAAIRKHFRQENKVNAYQYFDAVRSVRSILYIKEKKPYFLLCGNLGPAKGLDLAIDSFALFANKSRDYRLIFIGNINAEYKEVLVDRIEEHGISDLVEFKNYAENIDFYFQEATGYLMCSRSEAMGRVTVEAMFNGCPVIGYNGGGTTEIIQNGVNGFLFNTIEECAHLMSKVIYPSITAELIQRGHETVKNNFSEEVYCERIMQVYNNALNK